MLPLFFLTFPPYVVFETTHSPGFVTDSSAVPPNIKAYNFPPNFVLKSPFGSVNHIGLFAKQA
jgi:hypothetical protein